MPEALTESFCERCGTRYEFKAPTRLNPLRKTRGLVSGLRNYIMSQDALSDAIGDAMRSEEDLLAARQLESFHESFNFCIDCRQYTCNSCWNESAGRCRTCLPVAGTDDLIERFEASFSDAPTQAPPQAAVGAEAWPSADLENGDSMLGWPATELREHPDAFDEAEPVAAEVEDQPEPEPIPEPVVLAWDDDASFELVEEVVVEQPEPVEEPALLFAEAPTFAVEENPPTPPQAIPEPAAEIDVPAEAEIIEQVAEAPSLPVEELIAEPIASEPPAPTEPTEPVSLPRPAVAPTPSAEEERIAAAAAMNDPALAARRAQLDSLGLGDTAHGALPPQRPVRPYRSSGAGIHPMEAGQIERAAPGSPGQAIRASMWDASAREVTGALGVVGVQSCGQCGLSLSANARFCRRCGTPQARSA